MRTKIAAPLILCLVASSWLALSGSRAPALAQSGGETPLGRAMSDINGSMRKLEEQLSDAQTMAGALDEICRLQKVAIDAKGEVPTTVSSITDEKKRDKARIEYRLQVQHLVRALLDLEAAALERDEKKAKKALREIDKAKDAGHAQFKPKD